MICLHAALCTIQTTIYLKKTASISKSFVNHRKVFRCDNYENIKFKKTKDSTPTLCIFIYLLRDYTYMTEFWLSRKEDYKIWFHDKFKPFMLKLWSKVNLTRIVRHLLIIFFDLILTFILTQQPSLLLFKKSVRLCPLVLWIPNLKLNQHRSC